MRVGQTLTGYDGGDTAISCGIGKPSARSIAADEMIAVRDSHCMKERASRNLETANPIAKAAIRLREAGAECVAESVADCASFIAEIDSRTAAGERT